jgi:hypothetical protein
LKKSGLSSPIGADGSIPWDQPCIRRERSAVMDADCEYIENIVQALPALVLKQGVEYPTRAVLATARAGGGKASRLVRR